VRGVPGDRHPYRDKTIYQYYWDSSNARHGKQLKLQGRHAFFTTLLMLLIHQVQDEKYS
jgi:hypothetical protein